MKTIGVMTGGSADQIEPWTFDNDTFSKQVSGDKTINIPLSSLPIGSFDNELFSFDGISGKWVNIFLNTLPSKMSVADYISSSGINPHAQLVFSFKADPVLVLFGKNSEDFKGMTLDSLKTLEEYNATKLFPKFSLIESTEAEVTTVVAQLIEVDGTPSTKSDVITYWETTGGYLSSTRVPTVNGLATVVVKDFGPMTKVKVGFKNYPAKASIELT